MEATHNVTILTCIEQHGGCRCFQRCRCGPRGVPFLEVGNILYFVLGLCVVLSLPFEFSISFLFDRPLFSFFYDTY